MKQTFERHLQIGCGADYPLRSIIDNLTDQAIEDEVNNYVYDNVGCLTYAPLWMIVNTESDIRKLFEFVVSGFGDFKYASFEVDRTIELIRIKGVKHSDLMYREVHVSFDGYVSHLYWIDDEETFNASNCHNEESVNPFVIVEFLHNLGYHPSKYPF